LILGGGNPRLDAMKTATVVLLLLLPFSEAASSSHGDPQEKAAAAFRNPRRVTIQGYQGDAMAIRRWTPTCTMRSGSTI
jgi:hypothetical protein